MRAENFLRHGTAARPPKLVPLRAGPLSLLYDPTNGMVRRIKWDEREVLRGIYAAVRDRNWGTVPGVLRETVREVGPESFRIEFTSEHRQGDIHFQWRGVIIGTAKGEVEYTFDGEARTTFLRNRIGFCVLHPIKEGAGARARQRRTDGSVVEGRFPELIEPQIFGRSSFQELGGVAHEVAPGMWADIEFTGDTFEMEDQRNWTDASFKTYCTPLAQPFPVEIAQGTRVRQTVRLRVTNSTLLAGGEPLTPALSTADGARGARLPVPSEKLRLLFPDTPNVRLPAIGLGMASHGEALTALEQERLRALKLAHLRADVRLGDGQGMAVLEQALGEARQLGVGLELALHLPRTEDADFSLLRQQLRASQIRIVRVLALREGEAATTAETLQRVRDGLGNLSAPVAAGSDANFCELNREHALGKLALAADELFWSLNPQVHASDALSIAETIEAQAATALTARAFAEGRPLVVTPVTLKQRFNPVATGNVATTASNELPSQVDARQLSGFAAAWTLATLATVAGAGVASVTFYETTGWRGVMERASGSPLPDQFPSVAGEFFPIYEVFAAVAGFSQCAVAAGGTEEVMGLGLYNEGKLHRVLVANLADEMRTVQMMALNGFEAIDVQLEPYSVFMRDFPG